MNSRPGIIICAASQLCNYFQVIQYGMTFVFLPNFILTVIDIFLLFILLFMLYIVYIWCKSQAKEKANSKCVIISSRLRSKGWLREKVKIPGPYRLNSITARYSYILKQNKENYNVGINCTLGRKCRGSPWTKEIEIRRVSGVVQKQWMEGKMRANRSWI